MKLKSIMTVGIPVIAALAITSAAQAADPYLDGVINLGIGASGGGIVFQEAGGAATTDLSLAAGIQSWTNAVVESSSGSLFVAPTSAVTFNAPWNFSDAKAPLWSVGGAGGISFDITSASVLKPAGFLLIEGTGTLKKAGYTDTPGTWLFSTQGANAQGVFSWKSSAFPTSSVPDGGATVALLGFTLLGLHGVRRKLAKR